MNKCVALLAALAFGLMLPSLANEKDGGGRAPEKKGVIVGKIVSKDGAKIVVEGEQETLRLMPYWRGQNGPGGGFDRGMVSRLDSFKVGDRVKVEWTFQEHHRINWIMKLPKDEGGGKGGDAKNSHRK